MYRVQIIMVNKMNRTVSRMRKTAATGRRACDTDGYGRLRMRVAGIPVPIVTLLGKTSF